MQNEQQEFQEKYQQIKKDVRRVIVINFLIVAILVGLYFADRKFGVLNQLEKLF